MKETENELVLSQETVDKLQAELQNEVNKVAMIDNENKLLMREKDKFKTEAKKMNRLKYGKVKK